MRLGNYSINKYGQTAIKSSSVTSIGTNMFGEGTVEQKKDSPKNTFFRLCETGWFRGIKQGSYAERSTS
jgi:hypothetical protein